MLRHALYLSATAAAIVMPLPTYAAEWMTDFEAAKAKSQKENKPILIDFTGSDWCGWCIRMRSTILDTPAFQEYAKDKFVLLEVDVPKNVNKIGAKQHARNREIAAAFNISTYPTLLVLDTDGTILGGIIGGRDSLQHVTAPLNAALTTKTKLRNARKLEGETCAVALMEVYTALRPELKPYFISLRSEIAYLDPNNLTGIHTEIEATQHIEHLQQQIIAAGNNINQALQLFDKALKTAPAECTASIHSMRMEYLEKAQYNLVMTADTEEDVLELKKLMLLMADFSEEADAAALHQEIEAMFSDPKEALKTLKAKQKAH